MLRNSSQPVVAVTVLSLFLAAGATVAMAGSTQTATLRGKVADEKGEPLVGVVLGLHSDSLIRDRAVITAADGTYFAPGLAAGAYTVTAQLDGYIKTQLDTQLFVDKTTELNVILKAGEVTEEVVVHGEAPVVDTKSTEGAISVEKTFSEQLPLARNYQALIGIAPGVANVATTAGNPNVLGGLQTSNNYLVDGVSTRDPVTGTFGSNLVYDSIESVDVKLYGVSAEYGQFQGGVANIVTRSGGNDFTGAVRSTLRSPAWTAQYAPSASTFGPAGPPQPPAPFSTEKTNDIETSLGGPFVRDHAWFFIEYQKIQTALDVVLGNPTGGLEGKGFLQTTQQGDFSLIKGTWQVSNNHRVQYQWSEDPFNVPVCYTTGFFGGQCYEDYNVDKQQQGGHFWTASWDAVWSPRIYTDVKFVKYQNGFPGNQTYAPVPDRPDLPHSRTNQMGLAIDTGSGFSFDNRVFGATTDDRPREQYEASATFALDTKHAGSHTLKVGLDYNRTRELGQSTIAGDALFYFSFANPPAGLPGGGNGDPYDINNRAYSVWIDFAPPSPNAATVNKFTNLYVQDDWALDSHWTFNLGLRGEKSVNENDVGEKIIDSTGLAPRLGASYDVTAQGKHVLKATAARYLAGINLTTLSPFLRLSGGQSSYNIFVNTTGTTGTPDWVLVGQHSPDPRFTTFAPGIKPQRIDEYTLSYEWGISPTMGAKVHLVDREWGDITTTRLSWDYSTGTPSKVTNIYNNPAAKRNFTAAILEFEKRFSDSWQLVGNYTYSKAKGNVTNEDGFDSFGSYAGVPQTTENRYGFEPWDARHQVKLFASYAVPLPGKRHALTLGSALNYQTGAAYGKQTALPGQNLVVGPGPDGVQDVALGSPGAAAAGTDDQTDNVLVFTEPRGSRTAPSYWQLDLSAKWLFYFTKKVAWETRLEVFNVTNNQDPVNVLSSVRPDLTVPASFGFPQAYTDLQTPRTYDFVIALTW